MEASRELNAILLAAWHEAETRHHEYLTPEHVLFAALAFDRPRGIVVGCGGNLRRLARELERYLKDQVPVVEGAKPVQSAGFQAVLERAVQHTVSAEKSTVEIDDVIVAIFDEKDSFAAHYLVREGIDRYTLLSYVAHGAAALPEETDGRGGADDGRTGGPGRRRRRGRGGIGGRGGRAAGGARAGGRSGCGRTRRCSPRSPRSWCRRRATGRSTPSSAATTSSSARSRCSAAG